MKESWRHYDYLRRWGLFVLLGLALGALAGFVYSTQQEQKALFKATAGVSVSRRSATSIHFRVVSDRYSDPNEAIGLILKNVKLLRDVVKSDIDVDVDNFLIEGWYQPPLWKPMVLGSIIGGLLALGAAFIWDDAGAYLKHRRQAASKDTQDT